MGLCTGPAQGRGLRTAHTPYHALGLTFIRQKRYAEALDALKKANSLAPDNARYAYVYAVALQSVGQASESAAVIAHALGRTPNDADLVGFALNGALRSGDIDRARLLASKLTLLRPDDADIARLNAQLRQ